MKTKKVILILNGSHSEIPLILSAKKIGLRVITTGNDPRQIGHKFSDKYIRADFSKKKLILEIAKKNKIDFICPSMIWELCQHLLLQKIKLQDLIH